VKRRIELAGHAEDHLHGHLGRCGSDLPCHADAVTLHPRYAEGEHVFAPLEPRVLLDHTRVVAEAAGGDDHRSGGSFHRLAGTVFRNYARHAVPLLDDLLHRGLKQDLDPGFLGPVGQDLHHGGVGLLAGPPALRHDDMPGELPPRKIRGRFRELDAQAFEPIDGRGRLVDVGPHQARVDPPMSVVHEHAEGFVSRGAHLLQALQPALDAEWSHAHAAGAACGRTFLERDHPGAPLGGGEGCSQARRTRGDDDDVGFQLVHRLVSLSPSDRIGAPESRLRHPTPTG
jgi:hypothetical protein